MSQVKEALNIALDHLRQYRRYSEEMRKIGRGFDPSSPYSQESVEVVIRSALESHESQLRK
jgi:hypothetical protein